MENLRRWIPALVILPILAGAILALVLVLRNNATQAAQRESEKQKWAIEQAQRAIEDMFAPRRFTDDERATMKENGTTDRGWAKTAAMVMAKNPMSLKAFRASRGRVDAFHVFISIEDVTHWGDRSGSSADLLGFHLKEFDGTDAGFAVIEKKSYDAKRLFEITKDGKSHPVLIALWFEPDLVDPKIMFVDN